MENIFKNITDNPLDFFEFFFKKERVKMQILSTDDVGTKTNVECDLITIQRELTAQEMLFIKNRVYELSTILIQLEEMINKVKAELKNYTTQFAGDDSEREQLAKIGMQGYVDFQIEKGTPICKIKTDDNSIHYAIEIEGQYCVIPDSYIRNPQSII